MAFRYSSLYSECRNEVFAFDFFAVCFQIEFCHFKRIFDVFRNPLQQNFLTKKKTKKKESRLSGGKGWTDKVFGKNTTRRVEIFFKTRRAWPFQTKPSAYHCDLFYSFATIFIIYSLLLINALLFDNSNGAIWPEKNKLYLIKSVGLWGQVWRLNGMELLDGMEWSKLYILQGCRVCKLYN